MKAFIKDISKIMEESDLQYAAKIINSSYDPFNTEANLWNMLSTLIPSKIINKYRNKLLAHEAINDILLHYYSGERIIKYYLTKEFLNLPDEITLFEMYISRSRLDMARVNGQSYAYEIKTNLDNLNKLSKQVIDYSKAFEYVHVIADKIHIANVENIVPDYCGIITYELHDNNCSFCQIRSANRSPNNNSQNQLDCLSSRDYEAILRLIDVKKIPNIKEERRSLIYQELNEIEINEIFKTAIKNKFQQRWAFLCEYFGELLPVDIQTFFACQVDPKWVYYKNFSNT